MGEKAPKSSDAPVSKTAVGYSMLSIDVWRLDESLRQSCILLLFNECTVPSQSIKFNLH